jgi:hypothetical protein
MVFIFAHENCRIAGLTQLYFFCGLAAFEARPRTARTSKKAREISLAGFHQ